MNFNTWLMHNRWRSDAIGDLARDAKQDPLWPKGKSVVFTYKYYKSYLGDTQACDGAKKALMAAWREYELYVGGPSQLNPNVYVAGVMPQPGLSRD